MTTVGIVEQAYTFDKTTGTMVEKPIVEKYIKGIIPYDWVARAAQISGKAGSVAWVLWYLKGVKKSSSFKLSHKILKEFGIKPKTSYRILEKMQADGLIKVEKKAGNAPFITMIISPKKNQV